MENFGLALTRQRAKGAGNIAAFSTQYTSDQSLLAAAQTPKNYAAISADASKQTAALDLMSATYAQLTTFKNTISQMQKAQLEVAAMQSQYQGDMQSFNKYVVATDFQNLGTLINAQYQEAVVNSFQALPYVGAAKLNQFKSQVSLLKQYGMDPSVYQKQLSADTTP